MSDGRRVTGPARCFVAALPILAACTGVGGAAEIYPSHGLKLIAPVPAGGETDALCRLVADRLSVALARRLAGECREKAQRRAQQATRCERRAETLPKVRMPNRDGFIVRFPEKM